MITTTMTFAARRVMRLAAATGLLVAGACATTRQPAQLSQAEAIYQTLQGRTDPSVESDVIRARDAISAAREALNSRHNRDYVEGLAHIALRAAQTAEAEQARVIAQSGADTLRTARLNRLLALSQQQRDALAAQQALSAAEIAALRERTATVTQEADSLRRVAEQANERLNAALTQLRTLVTEITNLRETTRGLVISLSDILFDVDKATLRGGAEQNVRRIAAILNQYPEHQIAVEGHTDATGGDAYNQKLSEDRAAAVRLSLVAGGIDPARITSRGYGKAQPVATNDTPEGRQQNRRVEVIVLGAGRLAGQP
jgi:outer membrane protein OmpA-like peptidoglycan-associated protein